MKKVLLLFGALLFTLTIVAQDVIVKNVNPVLKFSKIEQPSQAKNFVFDGKNFVNVNPISSTKGTWHYVDSVQFESSYPVGMTNYDLQSNSGARSAIIENSANDVSVVFTQYHGSTTSYPQRGTGYAYTTNGTDWTTNDQSSNQRVEGSSVKSGWGSLLANGTEEFVVSHLLETGAFGRYQNLHTAIHSWSGVANLTVTDGLYWPRTATNGTNYYIVGVTGSDGFTYGRSTDAGRTWSFSDLPDFSTLYHSASGDSYSIDARENIVAIVYFGEWGDITLWKSTDYGQTFTRKTIADFPVDAYNPKVGPIIDKDGNGVADTLITSDGCGDIVIDKDGTVHVVFGRMRVLDPEIDNQGSSFYFPYTDWILYWNDTMPVGHYTSGVTSANFHDLYVADEVDTVAWFIDLNNNDSINFPNTGNNLPFGIYYTAMTSQPTLATDAYGNIFMAYTMVMETDQYTKSDAHPNAQNYRYVWFRYRTPWGQWSDFYNVSGDDGLAENVFPDLAPHIKGNAAYMWYQWDAEPGLQVRGDGDGFTDNTILIKKVNITYADSTNGLNSANISVSLLPNPVKDIVTINTNSKCNYVVLDINGREVLSGKMEGTTTTLNLSALQQGVYFVRLTNENGTTAQKIIKQ